MGASVSTSNTETTNIMESYLENIIQNQINNQYNIKTENIGKSDISQQNSIDLVIEGVDDVNINIEQSNYAATQKSFITALHTQNTEKIDNEIDQAINNQTMAKAISESVSQTTGILCAALAITSTSQTNKSIVNSVSKTINDYVNTINNNACSMSESYIKQINDVKLKVTSSDNGNINIDQTNEAIDDFASNITSDVSQAIEAQAKITQDTVASATSDTVTTSTATAASIGIGSIITIIIIALAIGLVVKIFKGGDTSIEVNPEQIKGSGKGNTKQILSIVTLCIMIVCAILIALCVWMIICYVKTLHGEIYTLDYNDFVSTVLQQFYLAQVEQNSYANTNLFYCVNNTNLSDINEPSVVSNAILADIQLPSVMVDNNEIATQNEDAMNCYNNLRQSIQYLSATDISNICVQYDIGNTGDYQKTKSDPGNNVFINFSYTPSSKNVKAQDFDISGNNSITNDNSSFMNGVNITYQGLWDQSGQTIKISSGESVSCIQGYPQQVTDEESSLQYTIAKYYKDQNSSSINNTLITILYNQNPQTPFEYSEEEKNLESNEAIVYGYITGYVYDADNNSKNCYLALNFSQGLQFQFDGQYPNEQYKKPYLQYIQFKLQCDTNYITRYSSGTVYGKLKYNSSTSSWSGVITGLISNNQNTAQYLSYFTYNKDPTSSTISIMNNQFVLSSGAVSQIQKGSAALMSINVPVYVAVGGDFSGPISTRMFNDMTEFVDIKSMKPYQIYYSSQGFPNKDGTFTQIIQDVKQSKITICNNVNDKVPYEGMSVEGSGSVTDNIYPFPYPSFAQSYYENNELKYNPVQFKYYFFKGVDDTIYKVYLKRVFFQIPIVNTESQEKVGWWIFSHYKTTKTQYIVPTLEKSYKTNSEMIIDYTLNNISNNSKQIPYFQSIDTIALTLGQKAQQIYYWPIDDENSYQTGNLYLDCSNSTLTTINSCVPIQVNYNANYFRYLDNVETKYYGEYWRYLSTGENDQGYFYPKYDGSTTTKYQISKSDIVLINNYLLKQNYQGHSWAMQDDLKDAFGVDEAGLKVILASIENYPQTTEFKKQLEDYLASKGESNLLIKGGFTSAQLIANNSNALASYDSNDIITGINSNCKDFFQSFKSGGADGQNIRLPLLQNFKNSKSGIIGSDYYISENDYNNNTISNKQVSKVNTQIIKQSVYAQALYQEAQNDLIESQEYYEKLYKNLAITTGSFGGLFLIAGMITGIIAKSK